MFIIDDKKPIIFNFNFIVLLRKLRKFKQLRIKLRETINVCLSKANFKRSMILRIRHKKVYSHKFLSINFRKELSLGSQRRGTAFKK